VSAGHQRRTRAGLERRAEGGRSHSSAGKAQRALGAVDVGVGVGVGVGVDVDVDGNVRRGPRSGGRSRGPAGAKERQALCWVWSSRPQGAVRLFLLAAGCAGSTGDEYDAVDPGQG
jgi:hypothetical protein